MSASDSGQEVIEKVLLNAAAEARQPSELRRGRLLMNTATEFALCRQPGRSLKT